MAFPTTDILDDFNRANEGPPPSGSWNTPSGYGGCLVDSNQVRGNSASFNQCLWSAEQFNDSEAYLQINQLTPGEHASICFDWSTPDFGSGYQVLVFLDSGTPTIEIYRIDTGAPTLLGTAIPVPTFDANDAIGAYHRPDGIIEIWTRISGVWSELTTRNDSTYSSGYAGIIIFGNNSFADNFGAGTHSEDQPAPPENPTLYGDSTFKQITAA